MRKTLLVDAAGTEGFVEQVPVLVDGLQPLDRARHGFLFEQRTPHGRVRYGLGLALVRRAMDDHAGRAWIESAPGGGARAQLEFGAVRDGEPPATSRAAGGPEVSALA